jgi:hypothetical protein
MYPLHTTQNQLSQETMDFVLSRNFVDGSGANEGMLRKIADLSYDLLNRISKSGKLRKLGQLGKSGEAEFDSNVRLVGLMLHVLKQYSYDDAEMMSGLEKKYQQIAPGITGRQV